MQIKKATITNYKGIKHVEIPFTKHMILLQGKNGNSQSVQKLQELVDLCREKANMDVNIVIGQAKDEPQENGFFLEEGELVK